MSKTKKYIIIIITVIVLIITTIAYNHYSKIFIYCPESIHSYGFAVDKNTVLFFHWEYNVITKLDLKTGSRTRLPNAPIDAERVIQISDTKFLLLGEHKTCIYDYKTGQFKEIAYTDYNAYYLSYTKSGNKIYIISNNTFVSYDLETDKVNILKSHICSNDDLDVLSDGKILITCDEHNDKEPSDLTIYDPATNKFDTLSNNFHVSNNHKILANDKILFFDGNFKLFNLKTKTFVPINEDFDDYSNINSNKNNKKDEIVLLDCNIYSYKPENNSINSIFEGGCSHSVVLKNGNILLFDTDYGPISSNPSRNVLFNIKNKKFYKAPNIVFDRDFRKQKSILLKDGRVLFYLKFGRRKNEDPYMFAFCPCGYKLEPVLNNFVEIYTPPNHP